MQFFGLQDMLCIYHFLKLGRAQVTLLKNSRVKGTKTDQTSKHIYNTLYFIYRHMITSFTCIEIIVAYKIMLT